MIKKTLSLMLVIVLSFAVLGCSPPTQPSTTTTPAQQTQAATTQPTTAAPKEPIKIGLCAMITGAAPADGERMRNAVTLAVEEINKAGGLLGREVQLIIEDDQTDQTGAVNACNKLISQGVCAVIGPHRSTNVTAVEKLFADAKIPFLVGGTSVKLATLGNEYFFRIRASDGLMAPTAGKYLAESIKAKKVGILFNNDEYGVGGKDGIESALKEAGVEFISEGHNTNDKDFAGSLMKIKNAGCDAIAIWAHDAEMVILARQITELGIDVPVIASPGITMAQVLEMCEPEWVEGWMSCTDYVDTNPDQTVQDFIKKYTAKYNQKTELYVSSYYGAAQILFEAIKAAGSDDPTAIRDALLKIDGLKVPNGVAKCNEFGELIHQVIVAKIENRAPVFLDALAF